LQIDVEKSAMLIVIPLFVHLPYSCFLTVIAKEILVNIANFLIYRLTDYKKVIIMITLKSQGGFRVMQDERLTVLCGVYNELNIAEKKKMEKLAVRLFNSQTAIESANEKAMPVEGTERNEDEEL
jgi:hypothetical protein